jgi:putative FmdB family regulatory protein
MPIYEYACDKCQKTFERKQKFSDDPVRTCPECGQDVRRVLYPAGIIFKGSGFYVTDNRGSKGASTSPSSTNGSSTPDSSNSNGSTAAESTSTTKSSTAAADN